ncbi:MAG TPA: signal recognition particle receptor subunit alpha [Candidatus Nanoarchaeia archaeon]|nr:signal recognition particle receptor subunit alpha [Candidatus Nanoarchaeia archaeon]
MVLDRLGDSLKSTLSKIANSLFVDQKLINELIKEIQKALLLADVNVKLVLDLTNRIKERALREDGAKGLTKKEQLINIVYEELVAFLGKEKKTVEIDTKYKPYTIMLLGLFGSGKTTTTGKLARYYAKRGFKVAVLGLDVHRPAAMDQIEQVARQANVKCFLDKKEKDPITIYRSFKDEYKDYDLLIVDTAGRDALSEDLVAEIEMVNKEIKPQERLLVLSGDIGQAAQAQATQFHKSCDITGIIVTKMDGTARGGGALTACAVSGAPIVFLGVGEKGEDLEGFNPQGFVGRLLGMGDIEALLEKTRDAISQEDAEDLGKRFLKGEFNLLDLYEQMEAMGKMGPLSKIVEMIPGFSQFKLPKEVLEGQEKNLKKWKIVMQSMTKKELEEPELIDQPRIDRIAKGSGMDQGTIRDLLKQHKQGKKMAKMLKGGKSGDMNSMMKQLKGRFPGIG